jgi:erythromycin esterase
MMTMRGEDEVLRQSEQRCAEPADLLPENGVLGLGEPTHGSGNVFTWKWDVILDLARRGLVSTLAFEESFAVGLAVDAALRPPVDGAGIRRSSASPALDDAWDRASSIWDTSEIRAGLQALRELNAELPPGRRIRFLGVDIRKPHETARRLIAGGEGDPVLVGLAERRDLGPDGPARLLAAAARITRRASRPSSRPSREEGAFPDLLLARQIVRYAETYLLQPDLVGLPLRERHMADTLLENLPAVGGTVLWAHNEHVARAEDVLGEAASAGSSASATPSMGWNLAEHLGLRYVPVGVLCTMGECRAVDPSSGDEGYRCVPVPPIRSGTTEHALAGVARGLHRSCDLPAHPGPRRFIGWQVDSRLAASDPGAFEIKRPSSDFDALQLMGPSTAAQ